MMDFGEFSQVVWGSQENKVDMSNREEKQKHTVYQVQCQLDPDVQCPGHCPN